MVPRHDISIACADALMDDLCVVRFLDDVSVLRAELAGFNDSLRIILKRQSSATIFVIYVSC